MNHYRWSTLVVSSLLCAAGCGSEPEQPTVQTPNLDAPPYSLAGFDLPGNNFYPEGVAVDSNGAFYVGSLGTGQVVWLPPGETTVKEFASAEVLDTAAGMIVDEKTKTLWVCDSSLSQSATAIVGLSLADGQVVARHPFPAAPALCNDLILDTDGNLYATDSFAPRIIRVAAARKLDGDSAESWATFPGWAVEMGQFGLNGITIRNGAIYVAHTQLNALFRVPVDPQGAAGDVVEIALDRTPSGLDGLETLADGNLLFVEGYADSLTKITLDENDQGTLTVVAPSLRGPTTFAWFASSAWVAEGQLGSLFNPAAPPPQLPFRVTRVELPSE